MDAFCKSEQLTYTLARLAELGFVATDADEDNSLPTTPNLAFESTERVIKLVLAPNAKASDFVCAAEDVPALLARISLNSREATELLCKWFDVNATDCNGNNALHLLLSARSVQPAERAWQLPTTDAKSADAKSSKVQAAAEVINRGSTPLRVRIAVQTLFECGCNPRAPNVRSETPLHLLAADAARAEISHFPAEAAVPDEFLLACCAEPRCSERFLCSLLTNANVNARADNGDSPLTAFCRAQSERNSMMPMVVFSGSEVYATDFVRKFLSCKPARGYAVNASTGESAWSLSFQSDLALFDRLREHEVEFGDRDRKRCTRWLMSLLMLHSRSELLGDDLPRVRFLLRNGADLGPSDLETFLSIPLGEVPAIHALHLARKLEGHPVQANEFILLALLLRGGACLFEKDRAFFRRRVFVGLDQFDIESRPMIRLVDLATFLDAGVVSVDDRDDQGRTLLLVAAGAHKYYAMRLLLERGASHSVDVAPTRGGCRGQTPLAAVFAAASEPSVRTLHEGGVTAQVLKLAGLLVTHGADIFAPDATGRPLLMSRALQLPGLQSNGERREFVARRTLLSARERWCRSEERWQVAVFEALDLAIGSFFCELRLLPTDLLALVSSYVHCPSPTSAEQSPLMLAYQDLRKAVAPARYTPPKSNEDAIPVSVDDVPMWTQQLRDAKPGEELRPLRMLRRISRLLPCPCKELAAAGVVPLALHYFRESKDPVLQSEASWVLVNVSAGPDDVSGLLGAEDISLFVRKVSDQHAPRDVVDNSVWTLGNLAGEKNRERNQHLLRCGVLSALLQCIRDNMLSGLMGSNSIVANAIWVMRNVFSFDASLMTQEMFLEPMAVLSQLLYCCQPALLCDVCNLLAKLQAQAQLAASQRFFSLPPPDSNEIFANWNTFLERERVAHDRRYRLPDEETEGSQTDAKQQQLVTLSFAESASARLRALSDLAALLREPDQPKLTAEEQQRTLELFPEFLALHRVSITSDNSSPIDLEQLVKPYLHDALKMATIRRMGEVLSPNIQAINTAHRAGTLATTELLKIAGHALSAARFSALLEQAGLSLDHPSSLSVSGAATSSSAAAVATSSNEASAMSAAAATATPTVDSKSEAKADSKSEVKADANATAGSAQPTLSREQQLEQLQRQADADWLLARKKFEERKSLVIRSMKSSPAQRAVDLLSLQTGLTEQTSVLNLASGLLRDCDEHMVKTLVDAGLYPALIRLLEFGVSKPELGQTVCWTLGAAATTHGNCMKELRIQPFVPALVGFITAIAPVSPKHVRDAIWLLRICADDLFDDRQGIEYLIAHGIVGALAAVLFRAPQLQVVLQDVIHIVHVLLQKADKLLFEENVFAADQLLRAVSRIAYTASDAELRVEAETVMQLIPKELRGSLDAGAADAKGESKFKPLASTAELVRERSVVFSSESSWPAIVKSAATSRQRESQRPTLASAAAEQSLTSFSAAAAEPPPIIAFVGISAVPAAAQATVMPLSLAPSSNSIASASS